MFNGCCLLPRLQFNKYRDFSALCIMIEIMSITDLELSNAFKTDVYFFCVSSMFGIDNLLLRQGSLRHYERDNE